MSGHLEVITGPMTKRCSSCKKYKNLLEFNKNSKKPDGRRGTCRKCEKIYFKKWHEKHPLHKRNEHFKRRYGITLEERNKMISSSKGICNICNEKPKGKRKELMIDHDKNTGIIRGTLCFRCNIALGSFDHDINKLLKAVKYLGGTP